MKQIIFKGKFLDLIKSGQKTQTIRNWKSLNLKPDEMVEATNYKNKTLIRINSINKKLFSEVTEEEAILDGFESLKELKEEVFKIYGLYEFEATVINFELVK